MCILTFKGVVFFVFKLVGLYNQSNDANVAM